ncbi:MAG: M60 family metallopeptidase [Candidatus Spyradosoma sp.]
MKKFLRVLSSALCFALALVCVPAALGDDFSKVKKSDFSASEMKAIFSDAYCRELKKGVTAKQVKSMKNPVLRDMAERMLAKKYQDKLHRRARKYRPYYPVDALAKELKTSFYSRYENPTGIYFKAGETAVLFVGEIPKKETISLKVHCFDQEGYGDEKVYPLEKGVNVVPVEINGLAYIQYFTTNEDAKPVNVNIATGHANGVFSNATHTNEDWAKMLDGVAGDCIDIVGKYVHLIYCAETMKQICPKDGLKLINTYDELIRCQQEDIMGLQQFKRKRPNHMLGRTMWKGYMHADGMGAAFNDNTMDSIADPAKVEAQAWGISHEFGHVNQTRPLMMWVCTAEVTNNIYSCWANFKMTPESMRLEHERCQSRDGEGPFIGGRFNSFLNSALVYGEPWLCQKGPDKMEGYENGGDHFVKVAPLWQLQLYMNVAERGPKDFYPQLFEIARTDEVPKTKEGKPDNGAIQIRFMKNACEIAKQNLMPFFEAAGMLKPIDRDLDDYTPAHLTITEADCKKLKKFGEKFPAPASPVIYYISATNYEIFKKGLPVKGSKGKGVEPSADGRRLTFSHKKWQNVVAFETYAGDKLVRVSMSGLDSKDNSSTLVIYPEGATRVEAVGWDGKRVLAYGKPAPRKPGASSASSAVSAPAR